MYENIGGKIKGLAKFFAFIGSIVSFIIGMILIGLGGSINDSYYNNSDDGTIFIIIGICVIILGIVISCISTWILYGFGELIDKTTEVANNTAMLAYGATNSPFVNTSHESASSERLKDLISLKERELISDEDFEAKKQAILRGE